MLDCDSNSPPRCQSGADDFHRVEYYEGVLSGFSLRPAVAQHGLEKNVIRSNLKMLLLLLLLLTNINMTEHITVTTDLDTTVYIYIYIYFFFLD